MQRTTSDGRKIAVYISTSRSFIEITNWLSTFFIISVINVRFVLTNQFVAAVYNLAEASNARAEIGVMEEIYLQLLIQHRDTASSPRDYRPNRRRTSWSLPCSINAENVTPINTNTTYPYKGVSSRNLFSQSMRQQKSTVPPVPEGQFDTQVKRVRNTKLKNDVH